MELIKKRVKDLISKHETNNPFKLAKAKGVIILYEDLGKTLGYFSNVCRIPVIHINNYLTDQQQQYTCAHELGHAILHPNENTPFLKANTLFSTDKIEIEANTFAIELLFKQDTENVITLKEATEQYGVSEQFLYKKFYP